MQKIRTCGALRGLHITVLGQRAMRFLAAHKPMPPTLTEVKRLLKMLKMVQTGLEYNQTISISRPCDQILNFFLILSIKRLIELQPNKTNNGGLNMPPLKRIYFMVLVFFMFFLCGTYLFADCTIKLKDGRTIKSDYCEESEQRFYYYKYGSKVSIDIDKVDSFSRDKKEITNESNIKPGPYSPAFILEAVKNSYSRAKKAYEGLEKTTFNENEREAIKQNYERTAAFLQLAQRGADLRSSAMQKKAFLAMEGGTLREADPSKPDDNGDPLDFHSPTIYSKEFPNYTGLAAKACRQIRHAEYKEKTGLDDPIASYYVDPSAFYALLEGNLPEEEAQKLRDRLNKSVKDSGLKGNSDVGFKTTRKLQLQKSKTPKPRNVSCKECNGTGSVEGWRWGKEFVMNDSYGNPIYKQVQVPTHKNCPICNGLGYQYQMEWE